MQTLLPRQIRLDRNREAVGDPRNRPGLWRPGQMFVWRRGSFTVPSEVSEQRVQDEAYKYRKKFGAFLELEGFTVLGFDGPHHDTGMMATGMTAPDRRSYRLWAKVTRRPVVVHMDTPDADVPMMAKLGWKLNE